MVGQLMRFFQMMDNLTGIMCLRGKMVMLREDWRKLIMSRLNDSVGVDTQHAFAWERNQCMTRYLHTEVFRSGTITCVMEERD